VRQEKWVHFDQVHAFQSRACVVLCLSAKRKGEPLRYLAPSSLRLSTRGQVRAGEEHLPFDWGVQRAEAERSPAGAISRIGYLGDSELGNYLLPEKVRGPLVLEASSLSAKTLVQEKKRFRAIQQHLRPLRKDWKKYYREGQRVWCKVFKEQSSEVLTGRVRRKGPRKKRHRLFEGRRVGAFLLREDGDIERVTVAYPTASGCLVRPEVGPARALGVDDLVTLTGAENQDIQGLIHLAREREVWEQARSKQAQLVSFLAQWLQLCHRLDSYS
jgi:hypothetical protein